MGYWDINAEYKIQIKYYILNETQESQSALWALGYDYGPTLYHNDTKGLYWKFPKTSLSYFSHISTGTLTDRQIKISNYGVLNEATIEYRCIGNETEYLPWAATLFARPTATEGTETELSFDRKIKAKLYSYKMWKNGELVSNCIPCKTLDGTVGLYEVVNRDFKVSYNNVPFIAGPII